MNLVLAAFCETSVTMGSSFYAGVSNAKYVECIRRMRDYPTSSHLIVLCLYICTYRLNEVYANLSSHLNLFISNKKYMVVKMKMKCIYEMLEIFLKLDEF